MSNGPLKRGVRKMAWRVLYLRMKVWDKLLRMFPKNFLVFDGANRAHAAYTNSLRRTWRSNYR